MKLLIAALMAFICLFSAPKVKIVDATSQEWYGGRYETGRGTDYIIKIKARGGSENLVIDKLWVGEDFYEVIAIKNPAKKADHYFEKGDTLYIMAGKKIQPDINGSMVKVTGKTLKTPKEFAGAALLVYTWKGKEKFLEVKEFRILEKIIYP